MASLVSDAGSRGMGNPAPVHSQSCNNLVTDYW